MILGQPTRARDVLRFIDWFAAGPVTWIEPFVDALALERAARNQVIGERNAAIRQRDQYRQLTHSQTWSRLTTAEDAVKALAGVKDLEAKLRAETEARREAERRLAAVLRPQFEPPGPFPTENEVDHGDVRLLWCEYFVPEWLRERGKGEGQAAWRGNWKVLAPAPDG